MHGDLRTPDKLIDGVCGSDDAGHMWLAPILPGVLNSVYIIFNEPWSVSQIRLWNYSKTPSRGVRDIAVSNGWQYSDPIHCTNMYIHVIIFIDYN